MEQVDPELAFNVAGDSDTSRQVDGCVGKRILKKSNVIEGSISTQGVIWL